jgi:hypothetical protein
MPELEAQVDTQRAFLEPVGGKVHFVDEDFAGLL